MPPIISGMMIFFAVTTIAVLLYPVIKLTPSWLDRSINRKIAFHRSAVAALATAISRSHNAPDQLARLTAQHDWHRAALAALAPQSLDADSRPSRRLDAAA